MQPTLVSPEKAVPWSRLPAVVSRRRDIRPASKVIYGYLCRRWPWAHTTGGWVPVKLETALKETGLGERAYHAGCRNLEEAELIERQRTGRATRYRLLPIPEPEPGNEELQAAEEAAPEAAQTVTSDSAEPQHPYTENTEGRIPESPPRRSGGKDNGCLVPTEASPRRDPLIRKGSPLIARQSMAAHEEATEPDLAVDDAAEDGRWLLERSTSGNALIEMLQSLGFAFIDPKYPRREAANQQALFRRILALDQTHRVDDPVAFLLFVCEKLARRRLPAADLARITGALVHRGLSEDLDDLFHRFEERIIDESTQEYGSEEYDSDDEVDY